MLRRIERAKNGPKNSDRGLTISSDASKDLTEDEELLLDRHRRFSRSERTKLRLTCLSPHGEMQEMEIALSPSSGLPKASGGIIDEGVVAKYRKMIKTGVPADAVRHEMIAEGVDAKAIGALLDETTAGTAVLTFADAEKDAGGGQLNLSLEDEKTASKYRKMLKIGIPPDAVRHKMTSDEIGPTIIAAAVEETKPSGSQDKLSDEEDAIAASPLKVYSIR